MMLEAVGNSLAGMAWPLALALAWLAGEAVSRWLSLPRVCGYALAGFVLASGQLGLLPAPAGTPVALLADFAIALVLFELGQHINLNWLRHNRWLAVTSLVEAFATFIAVLLVARVFGLAPLPALLLAALAMSSSPVAALRVANELRCSGQVTERMLHLSAFNCVFAVLVFKAIAAYWVLTSAGGLFPALWHSLVVIGVSAGIGAMFGVAVPILLRWQQRGAGDATLIFAIATLLLVSLTHALQFSALLAALVFGLVVRYRRIVFSGADRGFGTLGSLLSILLFVFASATLSWPQVAQGAGLALAVLVVRTLCKIGACVSFAGLSGIGWRKGALTGLALTPMSVFAILLLEQTRHLGIEVFSQVAGLGLLVLVLELLGPVATQRALILAGEAGREEGRNGA
jgi:Kef-type K+ transport system membrane component KefB